jgi:acetoin utilization deacetylase AcuC-like enzyme
MDALAWFDHPDCANHDTWRNDSGTHPESMARHHALQAAFLTLGLSPREAPLAKAEAVLALHSQAHLDRIEAFIAQGGGRIDEDTVVNQGSWEAAWRSAGAACAAVDSVLLGTARHAFSTTRPPGHHALAEQVMGFCLFANAAIAARHAQVAHGLRKVAILDWDVHHGNGSQAAFYSDPTVFVAGSHQAPHWPGTGAAEETGEGAGLGFTLNCPLAEGSGDAEILKAWRERIGPALRDFGPELLVVSAGYDAHALDPLGGLEVSTAGFAELTTLVQSWAHELCGGRLVLLLEGGYHLQALADSATASAKVLMRP